MNKKKTYRIISAFILVLTLLMFPVFSIAAGTQTVDPKIGFPYDDNENYRYRIDANTDIASGWIGSDYVLASKITIFDANAMLPTIISVDDYVITFKNLPKPENPDSNKTYIHEDDETKSYVYYETILNINPSGGITDPAESWKRLIDYTNSIHDPNGSNILSEGTFAGHKALFEENELVSSVNSNGDKKAYFSQHKYITVQLEDIPFPNAVFYMDAYWSASCIYYLGMYWDNNIGMVPDEKNIPTAGALYEKALEGARAFEAQLASITYEVKKTPHLTEEGKGYKVIVTSNASSQEGETGTSVPALIVLGIAGLAAAVAGAAGSVGNADQNNKKQAPSYKMYIKKEFKNMIRYDKPAVFVYARMAEISPSGEEIERTDLSQQIRIFSDDSHMKVGQTTPAGNYVGATVEAESIKGNENPLKGTVNFKFTGEGGSYQNSMAFDLILDPYIKFTKENGSDVTILEGDGGHYESNFNLIDFTEIPKVTLKPLAESYPFEIEAVKITDYAYKLSINNNTTNDKSKKRKPGSSFYKFELYAENEVENARTMVQIIVCPEGIVVRNVEYDKNDYALIRAFSDAEKVEGGEEVLATRLIIELAVGTTDEKGNRITELVDISKTNLVIDKIKGTDQDTENLANVFKYEIEDVGKGAYKFQPKMQIPEGENPYYMLLPMACSYNNIEYNLDFTVRLAGEPFDEMKSKQEELRLLLARVRRYMPPEEWQSVVQFFKDRFDSMSVNEIRLMNKSLIMISRKTLLKKSEDLRNFSNKLDWVISGLEWVKWIGDQAFSYVADYYSGPIGEALIVPAKDILVVLLADYAGQIWFDEKSSITQESMETQVLSGVMTAIENVLMTNFDAKNKDMKKIGGILAAFAILKFLNHYFNDRTPDGKGIELYDALMITFSDLTTTMFKAILQKKFDDFVGSDKVKAVYEKYCSTWVTKSLGSIFTDLQDNGLDIAKKYITEMFGAGCATIYGKATEKAGKSEISMDSGNLIITINVFEYAEEGKDPVLVDINVTKAKEKIINYIYESIFAAFPFASTIMPAPSDPPYFPVVK